MVLLKMCLCMYYTYHDPCDLLAYIVIFRFTEVLQDTFLDFFESEKLKYASATSIRFSPEGFKRFYDNWEYYRVKE